MHKQPHIDNEKASYCFSGQTGQLRDEAAKDIRIRQRSAGYFFRYRCIPPETTFRPDRPPVGGTVSAADLGLHDPISASANADATSLTDAISRTDEW